MTYPDPPRDPHSPPLAAFASLLAVPPADDLGLDDIHVADARVRMTTLRFPVAAVRGPFRGAGASDRPVSATWAIAVTGAIDAGLGPRAMQHATTIAPDIPALAATAQSFACKHIVPASRHESRVPSPRSTEAGG